MLSDLKFKNYLDTLDISKGDILCLTVDLRKILFYYKSINKVFIISEFLDHFLKKLGTSGTILIPSYSWSFCEKGIFDVLKTKSITGTLSNYILENEIFERTKHPMFSFLVKGKKTEELLQLDCKTGWGENSVFDFLYKNDAKNLFMGKDYKRIFTFMHYAEQQVGVDYRYFKEFSGKYIYKNKKKCHAKYQMYARKNDIFNKKISTLSIKYDNLMLKKKCYKKYFFKNIYTGIIKSKLAIDILINDLKNKKELLYLDDQSY